MTVPIASATIMFGTMPEVSRYAVTKLPVP